MHIVYAITGNFFKELSVSLISLILNNFLENATIVILMDKDNLEHADYPKFKKLVNKFSVKISVMLVNPALFENFPKIKSFSKAAYYRLLITELMPNLDRCIYLDADTIVEFNLEALWNVDLGGNYCAGVLDKNINNHPEWIYPLFENAKRYINSGVLLMDLKKWRDGNASRKIVEFATNNEVSFPDQDGINKVLSGKILYLDPCVNYQPNYNNPNEAIPEKRIIHYCGVRPWQPNCSPAIVEAYKKYENFTCFWNSYSP